MKYILCLAKNSWKLIVTIIGAIGIVVTLFSFGSLIATADDVKKSEVKIGTQISALRDDTSKSIKILNDKIEFQGDVQRLKNLDDIAIQLSIMIQKDPKNRKLLKLQENVDKERSELLEKILCNKNYNKGLN